MSGEPIVAEVEALEVVWEPMSEGMEPVSAFLARLMEGVRSLESLLVLALGKPRASHAPKP